MKPWAQKIDIASAISIVIALLAFAVSVRSCHVANRAQLLASKEYKQERLLILKGKFEDNKLEIQVTPIDNSMVFLDGKAYFPPSIYAHEIPISPDGKFMHIGSISFDLKEYIRRKIPPKKDHIQASIRGKLPLIIDSYYAVKGETYTDRSLYVLDMDLIIFPEINREPHISWNGLLFIERYPANAEIAHASLDDLINNDKGMYIPPKSP